MVSSDLFRRERLFAGSRILEISNKRERIVHAGGERPSIDFFPHTRSPSPSARRRLSCSSRSEFLVCLLRNEHESSSETPRVIGFFPERTFYPSEKSKINLHKRVHQSPCDGCNEVECPWPWLRSKNELELQFILLINTGV